jgi:hypothetical protein
MIATLMVLFAAMFNSHLLRKIIRIDKYCAKPANTGIGTPNRCPSATTSRYWAAISASPF